MSSYIETLVSGLREKGYRDQYINLCVEYCERLINNNLPVIFDKDHLALVMGVRDKYLAKLFMFPEKFYKQARIPKKKKGEYREISIPYQTLKHLQRWILENILYRLKVSDSSKGFVPNLSIVENANKHLQKECVINIDIKDFFPSIQFNEIFNIFYYYGYTKEISFILARLCTYEGRLPQGSPASPYLSNLVNIKLDRRFENFCKKIGADYTRYADDITISGPKYISKYIHQLKEIITDEGYNLNEEKTRILFKHQRQEVTGLIVNEVLGVPIKMKKYLRQQIHYCKKFGVSNHLMKIGNQRSNFKEHLFGLAYYIKMVEKEKGEKFIEDLNTLNWDY
ncbi:retron St85 family RNA-directed DNA polymerase [Brevibacillus sp. SIMBA_040]|uniref:retron St85 family RNA-directed DNA polymerase n=1 Tax=unclassified Brevibacillus TaxID=2684853 RepID=UPI0039792C60